MANDNETVEQVCSEMMGWENHTWMSSTDHEYIENLATRALAAHNREVAAKDAEIARLGETLDLHDCYADEECEDADTARMCAEDELAAKDAEIAKLKACRDGDCERIRLGAEPCEGCHVQVARDEIARLRALVKDMADILKITSKNYFECEDRICILCGKKCGRNEAFRLINEAREVCK